MFDDILSHHPEKRQQIPENVLSLQRIDDTNANQKCCRKVKLLSFNQMYIKVYSLHIYQENFLEMDTGKWTKMQMLFISLLQRPVHSVQSTCDKADRHFCVSIHL